jgi:hypothetical protein
MQKRVTREYVSIVRRSADCASPVIESASSSTISLYGGTPGVLLTASCANALILLRTTAIPRSSDALSSMTRERYWSPNSWRAAARIVVVFPVPGGP